MSDIQGGVQAIIGLLKKMMSCCSLNVKLRLQHYSVTFTKSSESIELAGCSLILDTVKGEVKYKLQKSAAILDTLIKGMSAGIPKYNAAIKLLPLKQRQETIAKIIRAIFKLFTSGDDGSDVTSQIDVSDDEDGLSALLRFNLKIVFPKNVVVEIKKRQMFTRLRRESVTLDAKQSLELFKEPHTIIKRDEVQAALAALRGWISARNQLSAWQNIFEVVKCLQSI